MSTEHTPGPWNYFLKNKEYFRITAQDGTEIVGGCGCCGSPWIDNEADARLIAAAPELLAAMEKLVEKLSTHPATKNMPEVIQARAVITKATQ